jgi:hypothetical protein
MKKLTKMPWNRKRILRLLTSTLALGLLLLGCAPSDSPASRTNATAPERTERTEPKSITIVLLTEFPYIVQYGVTQKTTPGPDRYLTFHNNLTLWSTTGEPQPRLAQKIPSLQDGDWKVNPDGTMGLPGRCARTCSGMTASG